MKPQVETSKNLYIINKVRIEAGLPPLTPKKLKCLCCEHKFNSEGIHNKMCPHCRGKSE